MINKRKILAGLAVWTALVTSALVTTQTFADEPFSGSLTDQMTTETQTAVDQANNVAFGWVGNLIYTKIMYMVHFVFQANVLILIASLLILSMIAYPLARKGLRVVTGHFTGGWSRRKKK